MTMQNLERYEGPIRVEYGFADIDDADLPAALNLSHAKSAAPTPLGHAIGLAALAFMCGGMAGIVMMLAALAS